MNIKRKEKDMQEKKTKRDESAVTTKVEEPSTKRKLDGFINWEYRTGAFVTFVPHRNKKADDE